MDIIELTRKLCVELQKDEAYIAYASAKKANDEDKKLQDDIAKFNLVRMQLDQALSLDNGEENIDKESTKEKIGKLNAELRDVYSQIMSNESMVNYNVAKTKLDTLVNKMNAIITLSIEGEDPMTCEISEGCSGSCSSCSGCN